VQYGLHMGIPLPGRAPRFQRLLVLMVAFGLLGYIGAPGLAALKMAAALVANAGICNAVSQTDRNAPVQGSDCLTCLACHAVGQPGLLPVSLVAPVAIGWRPALLASWADATGPPPIDAAPFHSRAPPASS